MSRRRSLLRSSAAFLAVVGVIIAAAAGGIWLFSRQGQPPTPPSTPPSESLPIAQPTAKERRKVKIYVMRIVRDEPRLVPITRTIPADAEPHAAAVEKLLATNREVGPSQYLIPIGTKLLKLEIKNRVAYADFSREIKDNFNGGSINEALLLNSIVHTLTQWGDVDRVQILVDGRKIDTLGGHLEISEPVAPDSTLLDQRGEAE